MRLAYFFDYEYEDGRKPRDYFSLAAAEVEKWNLSQARSATLEICWSEDVPFVRDTRFSEDPIETTLSQAEIALIKLLDSRSNLPVALQRLATQYLVTTLEAEKILVKLKTKQWIIEEDDSAVSLIVDHSEEQLVIDKIVVAEMRKYGLEVNPSVYSSARIASR
jgi:hypothetical protein